MESRKIPAQNRQSVPFLEVKTSSWLSRLIKRLFKSTREKSLGQEIALENMIEEAVLQYESKAYPISRFPGRTGSSAIARSLLLQSGWRIRRVFNNKYVLESN